MHVDKHDEFARPKVWSLLSILLFPLCTEVLGLVLFFVLVIFIPILRMPLAAYVLHSLMDRRSLTGGSNYLWEKGWVKATRGLSCWQKGFSHFPLTLRKTVDLPAEKSYVFGYHPHGVMPCGIGAVSTDGAGWAKLFPGVRVHVAVLRLLFYVPFFREWLLLHDVISADRHGILHALERGHSVCIVVGGAREALEARPRTFRLVLNCRRGFFQIAAKTGASLVPIIAFGDNDIYTQLPNPKGSYLRMCQELGLKYFKFSLPLFYGQYKWFPIIPRLLPVTTVVGAPVETIKSEEPSDEYIKQLREEYIRNLKALYNEHKKYHGYENVPFEIVE